MPLIIDMDRSQISVGTAQVRGSENRTLSRRHGVETGCDIAQRVCTRFLFLSAKWLYLCIDDNLFFCQSLL